jgi:hypothetical protein
MVEMSIGESKNKSSSSAAEKRSAEAPMGRSGFKLSEELEEAWKSMERGLGEEEGTLDSAGGDGFCCTGAPNDSVSSEVGSSSKRLEAESERTGV